MRLHWIITFALFFASGAFTPARAQTRVGILVQELERSQSQAIKGLGEGLKQFGYEEKKNLFFEMINVKSNRAALQPAVGELLARKVTVIFTTGTSATRAAITASQGTPIVFVYPGNPVGAGLVKNLEERPKNLTGVAAYAAGTTEQRLALLREIVPTLTKILVFYDASNPYSHESFTAAETLAKKLGLQANGFPIKSTDELRTTLGSLRAEPGTAIFQIADDLFESDFEFLFETARVKKLPTMFNEELWAIRGALAAYGPNYMEMGRQAARLVDQIIKGQKPESLPIARATKFDLTLNYRTARFLDVSFSPELLKKAAKVIR
jgi:ABC-type uncharacterized transport system substrate-binding protein